MVAIAIELNPDYVRALQRRAELYEQTDKLDEALEDYKKVLDQDPTHGGARRACMVTTTHHYTLLHIIPVLMMK